MFHHINRNIVAAVTSLGLFLAANAIAAPDTQPAPPPNMKASKAADLKTTAPADDPADSKLCPELRLLTTTELKTRDPGDADRREAIRRSVGLSPQKSRGGGDMIEVAIHLKAGADDKPLRGGDGIAIHFRQGDTLYASINVSELQKIAAHDEVVSVGAMLPRSIPQLPEEDQKPVEAPKVKSRDVGRSGAFDHKGLTGKGVIVGICDTGIDWRHPDFIRPDGTSRILFLYDFFDDSYNESNGAVGTLPPLVDANHKPVGTLYTNEQINAALKGTGTVNSRDEVGHGTACAGTAAGNRSGDIGGVAPDADIIFAKVLTKGPSKYGDMSYDGENWVLEQAAKLHRPVSLSLSYGNHHTAHDGTDEDEQLINSRVGAGKPGAAVFISAGNDAQANVHGTQRFGPVREGQADTLSLPIELIVHKSTPFVVYFDHRDDWQLEIDGKDKFFMGENGKGMWLNINRSPNGRGITATWDKSMTVPDDAADFFHKNVVGNIGDKTDSVMVVVPEGRYFLFGRGISPQVPSGRFDVYVLNSHLASLGFGATRKGIVGSPGNADNAITVASYDFRSDWLNADGLHIYYNMELGKISSYSSLGFRRDGAVKPDIAAPGQYMLSPAAKDSDMAQLHQGHPNQITKDGLHLAWSGTSASSPYAAGVGALMLEKNPTLDAAQIKKIMQETADHSLETTGAVPNEEWGYGRLNPEKAIDATPAAPAGGFFRSDNSAPAADPIKQLQGTWSVVSLDTPGRKPMPLEEVQKMIIVITGNRMILTDANGRADSVFVTLDSSKTPGWMDLKVKQTDTASIPGIYHLDGDSLQLCWNKTPNGSRPQSFTEFGDKVADEIYSVKLKLQK